jgi:hypothetical protein
VLNEVLELTHCTDVSGLYLLPEGHGERRVEPVTLADPPLAQPANCALLA